MIHREMNDGVAVLRMQHGRASALDREPCGELAATFHARARIRSRLGAAPAEG